MNEFKERNREWLRNLNKDDIIRIQQKGSNSDALVKIITPTTPTFRNILYINYVVIMSNFNSLFRVGEESYLAVDIDEEHSNWIVTKILIE